MAAILCHDDPRTFLYSRNKQSALYNKDEIITMETIHQSKTTLSLGKHKLPLTTRETRCFEEINFISGNRRLIFIYKVFQSSHKELWVLEHEV